MPRTLLATAFAATLSFLFLHVSSAQAVPVTYDLVLTPQLGTAGGVGSFTIDGLTGVGNETFTFGGAKNLLAISFTIDGRTFDFDDTWAPSVSITFKLGQLDDIVYIGGKGPLDAPIALIIGNNSYIYSETYGDYGLGKFTASPANDPAPGETPLPGALPLFVSGLGALGFFAHRRKRKQAA